MHAQEIKPTMKKQTKENGTFVLEELASKVLKLIRLGAAAGCPLHLRSSVRTLHAGAGNGRKLTFIVGDW
jgi:hypothetical protein